MPTIPTHKLNSGFSMPLVGLGCWMGNPGKAGENRECEEMVARAITLGYTSFDTASGYGNEEAVGRAIRASGVPRESLFVTTKLAFDHLDVAAKFNQSFEQLGIEYIDLFLVHIPQVFDSGTNKFLPRSAHPTIQDTWAEMEKLLSTGKVRSIGVSNHSVKNLGYLLETAKVVPAVNQHECHPYLPQEELSAYCLEKGIHLTAHCPLGQYSSPILTDAKILAIAGAHKRSAGQVILAWSVQRGNWSVVPKSSNPERMAQNIDLPKLSADEMKVIGDLHKEPGKYKSLCDFMGGMSEKGKIYGWTYDDLGWDSRAFEHRDV